MAETISAVNVALNASTIEYVQQLRQAQQETTKRLNQMQRSYNTTATNVNRDSGALTASMSNVSYQIQDIAVQAQLGINPLIIMTQQLPQLVGGFGLWGAALGAVAAVIGGVIVATSDMGESQDELARKIEEATKKIKDQAIQLGYITSAQREFLGLIESDNIAKMEAQLTVLEVKLEQLNMTTRETGTITSEQQREFIKLRSEIDTLTRSIDNKRSVLDGSKQSEKDAIDLANERYEADKSLIASLQGQIAASKLSEEQQAVLIATSQLSKDATKEQREEVAALARELYRLSQATKTTSEGMAGSLLAGSIGQSEIEAENKIVEQERKKYEAAQVEFTRRMNRINQDNAVDEVERIQLQYDQELSRFETLKENQLISEEQYQQAKLALDKKYGEASTSAQLGNIDQIGEALGFQFNLQKNFALASALVDQGKGIANALSQPFPQNLADVASRTAAFAATLAQIKAVNFSQAHGGLDEVPSHMDNSTFLLKAGERVLQPRANVELMDFLEREKKDGGNSGGSSIVQNVNISGNVTDRSWFNTELSKSADLILASVKKAERQRPMSRRKTRG